MHLGREKYSQQIGYSFPCHAGGGSRPGLGVFRVHPGLFGLAGGRDAITIHPSTPTPFMPLSMPRRRHRDGECGRRHAHGGEEHNSLASSLHPRLQALGRLPPNLASVCHCHTKGGSCCAPDPYKKSPIPSRQLPMSRRSGAWALDPVRSRTVSGMDDTLAPSTLVTNTAWARQPTRCPGPTRGSRIGCDRRSHFPIPPSFPCLAETK